MEMISKYYKELTDLIGRAKKDGIDIFPYRESITKADGIEYTVENGIAVGKDILSGGEYKKIQT